MAVEVECRSSFQWVAEGLEAEGLAAVGLEAEAAVSAASVAVEVLAAAVADRAGKFLNTL